jgi:hypothetical protein
MMTQQVSPENIQASLSCSFFYLTPGSEKLKTSASNPVFPSQSYENEPYVMQMLISCRENARNFLKENPDITWEIEGKVREISGLKPLKVQEDTKDKQPK